MHVKRTGLALGVVALAGVASAALLWTVAITRARSSAAQVSEVACTLTRLNRADTLREQPDAMRFAQTDAFDFAKPTRIVGWLDERALAVEAEGIRVARYDLVSRALIADAPVGDVSRNAAQPVDRSIALPTPDPAHTYVSAAVRERQRPGRAGSVDVLYFHSGGAVLHNRIDSTRCALPVNSDVAGALPIITAEWSPDGERIAFLLQADPARLGPARLRVLDREAQTLTDLPFDGVFAATSLAWHPDAKRLLLTVVEDASAPSYESLAVVDVDARTIDRAVIAGARFFAASHWGAHWSPDGTALAVACAEPLEPDGPLTFGKACLFKERLQ
jgi:hypothetical protein